MCALKRLTWIHCCKFCERSHRGMKVIKLGAEGTLGSQQGESRRINRKSPPSSPWWKRAFSREREKGGLRARGGQGSVGSSRDTLQAPVLEPRPRLTGAAKTRRGPHRSPAGPAGFLCRRVDASRAPS